VTGGAGRANWPPVVHGRIVTLLASRLIRPGGDAPGERAEANAPGMQYGLGQIQDLVLPPVVGHHH
jgi:hypothetical protein